MLLMCQLLCAVVVKDCTCEVLYNIYRPFRMRGSLNRVIQQKMMFNLEVSLYND